VLIVGGLLAGAAPGAVLADHVPPHEHYVITPNGDEVEVGPDACANGPSRAFDNFHFNFHLGTPAEDAFTQENNPVAFERTMCD
jgi:hypothetical protein